MWSEFKAFLLKQNALALAVAVVIGTALNDVVKAIVADVIMPIVAVVTPSGGWQTATWTAGPFTFGVGNLASAILSFIIICFVAWRLTKFFPAPAPAPATKACQFCFSTVDVRATRCPDCTSAL
jgi:large conductance mechanosensitive channel